MNVRHVILSRAGTLSGFPGCHIPLLTNELRRQAEQIAAGTVFFYDTIPMRVGLRNIDWSGSHIKHQEWPAQLNRFFYLIPLAAAHRQTGEEKYASAARSYIEDWLSQRDYRRATNLLPGDNTLNMSIRMGTSVHHGWGGVLHAFLDSPSFDDAFLQEVLASLVSQGQFLSGHLSAVNNWRISQLDALVFAALRFPMMDNADRMLRFGIRGMRNALATQFLPDGVHSERTPGYHSWMTNVAANYHKLARLFPKADARVNVDVVKKAYDYAAQGKLSGLNDSIAPFLDPGQTHICKERKAFLKEAGLKIVQPPLDQVFPNAGHVFTRSGFKYGDDYLAFDAGTWGGGHCHLSRLSFSYRSGGRMLVADPGILNYEMSDPYAPYGKSTPAHSTLNLNGLNQSEADAVLRRVEFTKETALIHALYQGGYWEGKFYWSFSGGRGKGVFGSHERILYLVKGEYLLVLDTMVAEAGNAVRNCFQMGPMDGWTGDKGRRAWWSQNKDVNLFIQAVLVPDNTIMECHEGIKEPIRGWVGQHGHDHVAAPLVEFKYPSLSGMGGVASAIVLAAFRGKVRPALKIKSRGSSPNGFTHAIALGLPGGRTDYVVWTTGLMVPIEYGPCVTDGTFLWCRTDSGGKPFKCFVMDGSYVEFQGKLIYNAGTRSTVMVRKFR